MLRLSSPQSGLLQRDASTPSLRVWGPEGGQRVLYLIEYLFPVSTGRHCLLTADRHTQDGMGAPGLHLQPPGSAAWRVQALMKQDGKCQPTELSCEPRPSSWGSWDALKKKTAADLSQNHTTAVTGHWSVYTHGKTYGEQFYLVRPEGERSAWFPG